MARILIADDASFMRQMIREIVESEGHEVIAEASDGVEAIDKFKSHHPDLVMMDIVMPRRSGIDAVEGILELDPTACVVMCSALGQETLVTEALEAGAKDFITKPFPPKALELKVERILGHRADRLERRRLDEENRYLREEIGVRYGAIVGESQKVKEILATVKKVAGTDSSVLIYGESGSGKELVARAVHDYSSRRKGPFVKHDDNIIVRLPTL